MQRSLAASGFLGASWIPAVAGDINRFEGDTISALLWYVYGMY